MRKLFFCLALFCLAFNGLEAQRLSISQGLCTKNHDTFDPDFSRPTVNLGVEVKKISVTFLIPYRVYEQKIISNTSSFASILERHQIPGIILGYRIWRITPSIGWQHWQTKTIGENKIFNTFSTGSDISRDTWHFGLGYAQPLYKGFGLNLTAHKMLSKIDKSRYFPHVRGYRFSAGVYLDL